MYTINEIREVHEYTNDRGTMYQFYCVVVNDDTGEEADVRIDAKSSDRWNVGDRAELELKGKPPFERKGVMYDLVKANIPEELRQGGGGQRQPQQPRRAFGGGGQQRQAAPARGIGGARQAPPAQGSSRTAVAAPAQQARKARPFFEALEVYTRFVEATGSNDVAIVMFKGWVEGLVGEPPVSGDNEEADNGADQEIGF